VRPAFRRGEAAAGAPSDDGFPGPMLGVELPRILHPPVSVSYKFFGRPAPPERLSGGNGRSLRRAQHVENRSRNLPAGQEPDGRDGMSKELIVASGRHETRVAILEDDQLVEVFHEREKEYSLAGSIHKGRVTRVLPGMQSAFVDIGLERDAFLYVSDFFEDNDEYDAVVSTAEDKVLKLEKTGSTSGAPVEGEAAAGAAESSGTETQTAPSQAPRENRPPQDRGGDGRPFDRGGDQGRRGRRGRRRGGKGSGGIPESKYFSPGAERHARPVAEPSEAPTVEKEHVALETGPFERFVLPGESLAKYSVAERESMEVTAVAAASVEVSAAEIEPAIPLEHPLTGLSWSPAAADLAAVIEAEHPRDAEPEAVQGEKVAAAETPSEETSVVEKLDGGVHDVVAQVAEAPEADALPPHLAEAALTPEDERIILAEAVEAIQEEAIDDVVADETDMDGADEESSGEASSATGEGEGPEPARIPTSLTATLREQGHRYPHRVSRRSRRRGGRNRGEGRDQKPNGIPQPGGGMVPVPEAGVVESAPVEPGIEEVKVPDAVVVEEKSPALREEHRPDRGRDRGGRDRGRDRGRDSSKEKERDSDRPERERPVLPSISDLLKEGQEIIVQISKEPLGQKGARITSHIALPGRFVVYMPTVDHAGVSRKIPSDEERQRLKRVLQTHRQGIPGGYICRTAAEGKSEEELRSDMHFLYNLWLDMRQKAEKKPAPVLLHHDLDLVQRILRDQLTTSFKTIWVDNEEHYESILRFVQRFQPALVGRVKLYTRNNPIFDEFGIAAELEKALRPKVWLKSGGYIVINQTEALVAIDINTGKYVGKSNRLEDTIVKINTDAIKEIVRQIRLRDLGGIIVVDFIDMDERKNRQKVMLSLEEAMRVDRAPYKILQFNDFGLVAITRKRVKQSLERTLCAPCSYCEGAGYIKSPQTVITEILQEAQRMHKAVADQQGNLVLRVNPEVAKVLKSNQNSFLQEVEEILGKTVMVKSDPLLHQTKFDLA
jgi:Rne/Rng family ribonuclease